MIRWSNEIDEITRQYQSSFGHLNAEKLSWKPDQQTWSIAENIQHVIQLNASYFPLINSMKAGTWKKPLAARIPVAAGLMKSLILLFIQPDRRRKMKTFQIWEPSTIERPEIILDRFESHQEELKRMIDESQILFDEGAVIASPASRFIVYKLEDAFDIMVTHEKRHLNQARELLPLLPADSSRP
ncbi:MAG: DinB family protein [Balneolaceae bacterium]